MGLAKTIAMWVLVTAAAEAVGQQANARREQDAVAHIHVNGTARVYGTALNADELNNVQIGGVDCGCARPGAKVAFRFRAKTNSGVKGIRIYTLQTAPGYGRGNYGSLRISLYADDGTLHHAPGRKLAVRDIASPAALGPMPFIPLHSVPLAAGQLYEIVFENTNENPAENFVSTNSLSIHEPTVPMQPLYSDVDWAQLQLDGAGGVSPGQWRVRPDMTPIMQIDYADGSVDGLGYMEIWHPRIISGASAVRQNFTVSTSDLTVSRVSVRLARTSGPGSLGIRLEESNGKIIEQGWVDELPIPARYGWATFRFKQAHSLHRGHAYNLVLTSAPGTTFEVFPIRAGSEYGFSPGTYFTDGYAEYTDGSMWTGWDQWGERKSKSARLQFYFTLVN